MRLDNIDDVKAIQMALRTEPGKLIKEFIYEACGLYQPTFDATNRDMCLINDGKRQVAITFWNFDNKPPEDVIRQVKGKEA